MEKEIIHGVEVSDVHVELNDAPVTCWVWFKVNGLQSLQCLKKADDGMFWVERNDTLGCYNKYGKDVTATVLDELDEDVYDEFLDELYDYLDEVVFVQTQEAMSEDSECYELRYCEYGYMPQVGCTGSTFDPWILCAQKIEELEFYMREQSPLRRERYYIAQCVTHEVLKRF